MKLIVVPKLKWILISYKEKILQLESEKGLQGVWEPSELLQHLYVCMFFQIRRYLFLNILKVINYNTYIKMLM
jgi:hypothetical protein